MRPAPSRVSLLLAFGFWNGFSLVSKHSLSPLKPKALFLAFGASCLLPEK